MKRALIGTTIAVLVAGGAFAALAGPDKAKAAKPKWTGTITVAQVVKATPKTALKTTLASMAKIKSSQAVTAAMAAVSGVAAGKKLEDVELKMKAGFLVYEVDITSDKVDYEVIVDAGTGQVLQMQKDDDDGDDDDDDDDDDGDDDGK